MPVLIAVEIVVGRIRWLPEPYLPPYHADGKRAAGGRSD